MVPCVVMVGVRAGRNSPLEGETSARNLARPESRIFAYPESVTKILPGLMSL